MSVCCNGNLVHETHASLIVHLERLGSLTEATVRFYMAELSSALSFLHEKRIIHRYV